MKNLVTTRFALELQELRQTVKEMSFPNGVLAGALILLLVSVRPSIGAIIARINQQGHLCSDELALIFLILVIVSCIALGVLSINVVRFFLKKIIGKDSYAELMLAAAIVYAISEFVFLGSSEEWNPELPSTLGMSIFFFSIGISKHWTTANAGRVILQRLKQHASPFTPLFFGIGMLLLIFGIVHHNPFLIVIGLLNLLYVFAAYVLFPPKTEETDETKK